MDVPTGMAIGWLLILCLVAIAYGVNLLRSSYYSWWENCLFVPTFVMGRLMWRVHFGNQPPAEIEKGAVLVANHRSSLDPFFIQLAARRRVHWMVAKEFCVHFLFGPILRLCQVIPTNRSGMDTASTKHAIQLTQEDRLVGMFPEGKINTGEDVLLPVRGGAALVAIRGAAPLIPLYIEGSPYSKQVWGPLFMTAHVRITFGTAIYPESHCDSKTKASPTSQSNSSTVESDRLILAAAGQILDLAGRENEAPVLASARKRRGKVNQASAVAVEATT